MVSLLWSVALARPHAVNAWGNAGLDLVVSDRLTFGVNEELRVNLTEARVEELNTRVAVGYAATPWLQLAGHYRLDLEGWGSGLFFDQRFAVDGQVGGSVGDVDLSARQRIQPELSSSRHDPFRLVLRTRVRARVAASERVQPYVAIEPYLVASKQVWDRFRFDAGLAFPPIGLDISYRIDEPLAAPGEPHRHILTVGFTGAVDVRRQRP